MLVRRLWLDVALRVLLAVVAVTSGVELEDFVDVVVVDVDCGGGVEIK